MDHIIINMPDRASAESLAAAIKAGGGMEHPERKGVKSGEVVARQDEWGGSKLGDGHGSVWVGSSGRWCVDVAFPAPTPDIPALIEAWHADPTPATRMDLWEALRKLPGGIHKTKTWLTYEALEPSGRLRVG